MGWYAVASCGRFGMAVSVARSSSPPSAFALADLHLAAHVASQAP
jgi:hypothetical protein